MRVWRRAAALGAATAIATASAAFDMPAVAAAETISTHCGGSVTGKPGDTVKASTSVLGLNLGTVDLGVIQEGTTVLSKTVGLVQKLLCRVTVTVTGAADEVVKGVDKATPEPLKRVTEPVTGAVTGTTETLRTAAGARQAPSAESPTVPQRPAENPAAPPASGPAATSGGGKSARAGTVQTVRPSEQATRGTGGGVPGSALPYTSPLGFHGGDPSSFAVPGLRYGNEPEYAPQFGQLGDDGLGDQGGPDIRNAGSARALGAAEGEVGLPVLLAVLALAGVSAGLVRTWVVRSASGAGY